MRNIYSKKENKFFFPIFQCIVYIVMVVIKYSEYKDYFSLTTISNDFKNKLIYTIIFIH